MFRSVLWLQPNVVIHTREVYGFIDLLGDLGGVTELIMICFGFFLFPISEHSFILKAAKKFFLANSSDSTLFVKSDLGLVNDGCEQKNGDKAELPASY